MSDAIVVLLGRRKSMSPTSSDIDMKVLGLKFQSWKREGIGSGLDQPLL